MDQAMLILARWEGMISLRGTMEEGGDDSRLLQIPLYYRKHLLEYWPTSRDTAFLFHLMDRSPQFVTTTSVSEFDPHGGWLRLASPQDLTQIRPNPQVPVSFTLELAPMGSLLWRQARVLELSPSEMTLVDRVADQPGTRYAVRLPLLDGELEIEARLIKRHAGLKTLEFTLEFPWQEDRLLTNIARLMMLQGKAPVTRSAPFLDEVERVEGLLKLMAHHPALERVLCAFPSKAG